MKTLRSATARAVADVIAKAHQDRGLSQRDLASWLKRPHSATAMIESHQRQVNVAEFVAIAEALNADPADLFHQVLRERRP